MNKKFYSKNKIIVKLSIAASIVIGIALAIFLLNTAIKNFSGKSSFSSDYSVIFQCDYNDITKISVTNSENNVLVKTEDGWICNDNPEIRIGNGEFLNFLMKFKRIVGYVAKVNDDVSGFNKPSSVIELTTNDGKTEILTAGAKTDNGYFVKYSGNDKVYMVNELNSRVFFSTLDDFRNKKVFEPVVEDVLSINVINEIGEFTVNKFDSENPSKNALLISNWQVVSPINNQCKDDNVIKNLFANMVLKTDGFYKRSEDLSKYKLNKPICKAVYDFVDGTQKVISFGEITDGNVYVKIDGDEFIYRVPSRYLSILNIRYHDLLSSLAEIEKIENVNSIDITYNDVMHSITVERSEGELQYKCDGKIITKQAFSAVYDKIMSIYIEGSIELSGTGVFVCSISIVYNDGLTSKVIDFYTYENQYAAIIVNGELNYFTSLNKVQSIIDEFEKLL